MKKLRKTRRAPRSFAVQDLTERHHAAYFACLEEWSPEMAEAGDHKERWYGQVRDQGLRVKLAVDPDDRPIGMIQYLPIEHSFATGDGLYIILCIWVHGHREGVGDAQGQGVGEALLGAAEADACLLGAKGMAAWGLRLPVWMKASWFKKHGYEPADRRGVAELVWKAFTTDAAAPKWLEEQAVPGGDEDVEPHVTAFISGWCPAANLVYERAKRAAAETGVRFDSIDTSDPAEMRRYGRSDEVLVGGKPLQRGAPPSYKKVRKRIAKHANRARRTP